MKDFFKSLYKSKLRLTITVIIVAVAGYFIYGHFHSAKAQVSYVLGTASQQTIVTSVSGTGQVSTDRDVSVTPSSGGKLTAVDVTQGQQIKSGQTIAIVDETNNEIALNQAKAGLASAQANYDQVMAGSTSQQLQLAQLALQSDQQSLTTAQNNLQTVTKQQQQNVDSAQNTLLNSSLTAVAASTNLGNAVLTISGNYGGTTQGQYNITVYATGSGQEYTATGLGNGSQVIQKGTTQPLGQGLYVTFVSGTAQSGDTWTVSVPNTIASSYTGNLNNYQTAVLNQSSALSSAQDQITSAQNKLQQDQINLQQLQQPPTDQQAESAKASLINAQASLENAQINYNNNILTAPFDGTVAQLNNQVGDPVSASTAIAVLVTNQSIATIPLNEVDVSQVKVGDKVTMTFNAVDGLIITGTVAQIDNIGTVSQGVVSYNVKIAFDTEDPRVKSGMSVSASIITATAPDVLSVPNSAVQTQGATSYVLTLDPSKTQTIPGQTGVISSASPTRVTVQTGASNDTYTQITTGSLKAGDTVVTQTVNTTATKSAAATATSALRLGGGAATFGGGGAGGFGGGAAVRAGGTGGTARVGGGG